MGQSNKAKSCVLIFTDNLDETWLNIYSLQCFKNFETLEILRKISRNLEILRFLGSSIVFKMLRIYIFETWQDFSRFCEASEEVKDLWDIQRMAERVIWGFENHLLGLRNPNCCDVRAYSKFFEICKILLRFWRSFKTLTKFHGIVDWFALRFPPANINR